MKWKCCRCKKEKPIAEFSADAGEYKSQTKQRYCRACRRKVYLNPLETREKLNRQHLKELRKHL